MWCITVKLFNPDTKIQARIYGSYPLHQMPSKIKRACGPPQEWPCCKPAPVWLVLHSSPYPCQKYHLLHWRWQRSHTLCELGRRPFSHQSLCNPKIMSLLKATQKGFLNGCPILFKELVMTYLNPSPNTAKGHMKWPKKVIRCTWIKVKTKGDIDVSIVPAPVPQVAPPLLPLFVEPWLYPGPA